jgi:hypothetical protein
MRLFVSLVQYIDTPAVHPALLLFELVAAAAPARPEHAGVQPLMHVLVVSV